MSDQPLRAPMLSELSDPVRLGLSASSSAQCTDGSKGRIFWVRVREGSGVSSLSFLDHPPPLPHFTQPRCEEVGQHKVTSPSGKIFTV